MEAKELGEFIAKRKSDYAGRVGEKTECNR